MRKYLTPNWPAPKQIKAFISTRQHGCSKAPYDSFNLALNVKDNREDVLANRELLTNDLSLPNEPHWLKQSHSTTIINLDQKTSPLIADASFTQTPQTICSIFTADCMPLLVTNQAGSIVAGIHAGWRGLLAGIISNTINQLKQDNESLLVWLGPAISQQALKLNEAIYLDFIHANPAFSEGFKTINHNWHACLHTLATIVLKQLGVKHIFCSPHCSYKDHDLFFSYRRNNITGRFVSLIWIDR